MGDKVTLNLDSAQTEAMKEMTEDGSADSISEAGRTALNAGLTELGYLNRKESSALAAALNTVGFVTGLIGVVWVLITVVSPVGFRLPAVAFLLASVGAFAFEWLLRAKLANTWQRIKNRKAVRHHAGER